MVKLRPEFGGYRHSRFSLKGEDKVVAKIRITLLASKLGNGYQKAKSRHIFRDFIDATATLLISEKDRGSLG